MLAPSYVEHFRRASALNGPVAVKQVWEKSGLEEVVRQNVGGSRSGGVAAKRWGGRKVTGRAAEAMAAREGDASAAAEYEMAHTQMLARLTTIVISGVRNVIAPDLRTCELPDFASTLPSESFLAVFTISASATLVTTSSAGQVTE